MKTTNLEEAARKTAKYLYHINAEVHPELYQAIATLRQLINEEYKPERSISSQLIYTILEPAIQQLIREERLIELDLLEQAINQGRDMNKYKMMRLEALTDSHKTEDK